MCVPSQNGSTSLLLALSFVADVETIVEQSSKENSMEKSLKELDEHWKNLQLEYVPHKDTQIKLIKVCIGSLSSRRDEKGRFMNIPSGICIPLLWRRRT
mgnify:CR=1 FL=1